MKFTLSWLKDHLETSATLEEIVAKLPAIGLEVEEVRDPAQALGDFVVAYVKEAARHPNADRLQVCTVETAAGDVQVVCGAPNARAGLKVAFAAPGTVIPATGQALKKGNIRGVDSLGMLCSARELGLGQDHEGILELPADAPVGRKIVEVLGLNDPVIDVALTPNRADCAGVRGVARDLAAAGLGTLKSLHDREVGGALEPGFESPVRVHLEFPAGREGDCPLFVGRYIRGVKNGESPAWLKARLEAVGLRPISALVDITNYLCLDRARPAHVFDAKKLSGDLRVSPAHGGETLAALNGKTYTVPKDAIAIRDSSGIVSLAGIIGGETTGCDETTVDVFLEIALFDAKRIAETGRALLIDSDARYRFERGVDPAAAIAGAEAATRLILELCGGRASALVIAGREPAWRREITLRAARVSTLTGMSVEKNRQRAHLQALGCEVRESGPETFTVTPPSWRGDIHGEADLVEEILRIEGLDALPAESLPRTAAVTKPALSRRQRTALGVKRALAARGLYEAVTWSFMPREAAAQFSETGTLDPALVLLNPISAELDAMRPSILPNLLQAAGRNAARGQRGIALFEVGPVYRSAEADGQERVAASLREGSASPAHWGVAARPLDAIDAKADALAALAALGIGTQAVQVKAAAPAWFHPHRSGSLMQGALVLARFGEIHPRVVERYGLLGPVVAAEVFIDRVPEPKKPPGPARAALKLASLQPLTRDFAFLADEATAAETILRAVKAADPLIVEATLFDRYTGKGVPSGKVSLAVAVLVQPVDKTLTEEEIAALSAKIVETVARKTGAVLRS
jgi:phenylalanyl-tRNA synthetase beta chain